MTLPTLRVSPSNRRRADRAAVAIEANLRKSGDKPLRITVSDFSRTGCRVETLSRTHVGDRVWVTLPGFAAIEGVIRWSDSRGLGCEWAVPLHDAVYDLVRTRYPAMAI